MSDVRDFFEKLVYHNVAQRRFTQQSPVMPDVWIAYGRNPGQARELLMVPHWDFTPAELARELKGALDEDRESPTAGSFRTGRTRAPAVAYNQNAVVATLYLDQLVRTVLPMSGWWRREVVAMDDSPPAADDAPGGSDRLAALVAEGRKRFVDTITSLLSDDGTQRHAGLSADTVWMARVVGFLALISRKTLRERLQAQDKDPARQVALLEEEFKKHRRVADALWSLLKGCKPLEWDDPTPLYSVNRNRETAAAVTESVNSIKGDAARRVFDVGGEGIAWAVIDSGIDATHVAFRNRDAHGDPEPEPFPAVERNRARSKKKRRRRPGAARASARNATRVVASYDFVNIRDLLSAEPEDVEHLDGTRFPALESPQMREELKSILRDSRNHMIDWERLEPFLQIPHQDGDDQSYRPPVNRHGTHVAGIIAADWRGTDGDQGLEPPPVRHAADMTGVSPRIRLYDLRVLDDRGQGNEFAIMSALQFVRDLNNRRDFVAIHGVNLSFSIEHDVANYACGRTPVCEEAERLVGSGITVVAAAGNSGRARYLTPAGVADEGFRTVSITDPGNADGVITVGATHRRDPHTYGVSYFSSRGPTGDGRSKPDLVAPGEKIQSTVPGDGVERLDGTSMAAPHVSGAVALILSRHPELIGRPKRLKEILCSTATDLGRERYFQGAGLLDVLRALESF